MGTGDRTASLWRALFYLQMLVVCAAPGARVCAGLAPAPSEQNPNRKTDEAYYLSTTYVEQALGALYSRPRPGAVAQWGRFEAAVSNARAYAHPFEDVTLEVTLTKPDGAILVLSGFYDGEESAPELRGGVWRFRFMPDQTGTWHYETRFSDGSGQTSGSFLCVGATTGFVPSTQVRAGGPGTWPPGQIAACRSNPLWFGFKGGSAVLVRSFQVGDRFLADTGNAVTGEPWSGARRSAFLDWAQQQGYNMLSVPDCFLNDGREGRGRGWNTPVLWDARRQQPDCRAYRRLEAVLDDLAERGMLLYPVGGLFAPNASFPTTEAQRDLYARYTQARLGCYWNLLLGEPIEWAKRRNGATAQLAHSPILPFACSEISPRVLEGAAVTDLARLNRFVAENREAARPLYAFDALWAGSSRNPPYTPDELRKCAFVLMMSGATINFADMNGAFDSGFSGTLDLKQKIQTRHDILKNMWDYFDRIPFWRLKPRQDLVDTGYCLAEPGQRYVTYLEHQGTVTVKIEEGSYQVAWINARDTTDIRKAGIIDSPRALTSPQEQDDWLLSLVRVEIIGGGFQER